MRKLMAISLLACFGCLGCVGKLDDQIQQVDQDWHTAVAVAVAGGQQFVMIANKNEDSRDALRQQEIKDKVTNFLSLHTDSTTGRLTNGPTTRPGDVSKPLLASDLVMFINDRDAMMAQAAMEHQKWLVRGAQPFIDIMQKLASANDAIFDGKTSILAKRKEAASLINAGLSTLMAAGATAGIAAMAF